MADYEAGATRPDLAEKVAALRESGLSVTVGRGESQVAGPDGSSTRPFWTCIIASTSGPIARGEGSIEDEAFEDAYRRLPDLPPPWTG
jgi:hypothetical protein